MRIVARRRRLLLTPLHCRASPVADPTPLSPIVLSLLPAGELQKISTPCGCGPIDTANMPSRSQRVCRALQRLIAEVALVDRTFLCAVNAQALAASLSDLDTVLIKIYPSASSFY